MYRQYAWKDVLEKANRILADGGVTITYVTDSVVAGDVVGDNGIYESMIVFDNNDMSISDSTCTCEWGQWQWERDPGPKVLNPHGNGGYGGLRGRKCAHLTALYNLYMSIYQGGFGKQKIASKTMNDFKFIELDSYVDFDYDYIGDSIKYLYERPQGVEILEAVLYINDSYYQSITEEDIVNKYIESQDFDLEFVYDIVGGYYYDDFEQFNEYYQTIQEVVSDYCQELIDYFDSDEFWIEVCEQNNCQFGTVGYSPWSYYVAANFVEKEYITDVYEGYNFYNVNLLNAESGEVEDSIGSVYIRNENDLYMSVSDYFGINKDNFYLIDNAEAQYFNVPKVQRDF